LSDGTIPESAVVVIASDVLWSELGAEHILLSLRDGTYYGLEEVGGEIWQLLRTPVPVAEICRAIVERYDVEPARCRRDVLKLLEELVDRRLVEIHGPS
jgi:hypothetical protein